MRFPCNGQPSDPTSNRATNAKPLDLMRFTNRADFPGNLSSQSRAVLYFRGKVHLKYYTWLIEKLLR